MLLDLETLTSFIHGLFQHSLWHGSKKWNSSMRCHVVDGPRALMENLQLGKKKKMKFLKAMNNSSDNLAQNVQLTYPSIFCTNAC